MVTSKQLTIRSEGAGVSIVIPAPPVPASRPRVTRFGVYYGKTYSAWMTEVRRLMSDTLSGRGAGDTKLLFPTGALMAAVEIVAARPVTTKRAWPRGDVDNFEKAVYDEITKSQLVWADDDQIVEAMVVKRFARAGEAPHIRLWVAPTDYPAETHDFMQLPQMYRRSFEEDDDDE